MGAGRGPLEVGRGAGGAWRGAGGGGSASDRSWLEAGEGGLLAPRTYEDSDSKHWFTTSFLQPLPYLVTP